VLIRPSETVKKLAQRVGIHSPQQAPVGVRPLTRRGWIREHARWIYEPHKRGLTTICLDAACKRQGLAAIPSTKRHKHHIGTGRTQGTDWIVACRHNLSEVSEGIDDGQAHVSGLRVDEHCPAHGRAPSNA